MSFNQLVMRNIRRQPRVFLSYFLSSVFSVTVFFIAAMLYFHPILQSTKRDGSMRMSSLAMYFPTTVLLGYTLVVIGCLALLFLGTMFRLYLRDRRENFTLYLILGMTKNKLRKMLILESSLIGFSSLLTGLLCGAFFSKLIFLIVQNLLRLDYTLAFYIPGAAIGLTAVVYVLIFVMISFYTLLFVQSKQAMNINLDNPHLIEPRGNQYLTALGVMLLLLSYVALFSLTKITKWSWNMLDSFNHSPLLFGSLMVIFIFLSLGIYLFFQQSLVHFSLYMRKWPIMLRGGRVLALSNLSYRLKHNSLVYFLIVISAIVAFVTISVTMSLSKVLLYGTDQEANLAYSYQAINVKNQTDWQFHEENLTFIRETIKKAGCSVQETTFEQGEGVMLQSQQFIPKFYDDDMSVKASIADGGSWKRLFIIPLSKYNGVASFNGQPKIQLKTAKELVLLSGPSGQSLQRFKGVLKYGTGTDYREEAIEFRFMMGTFNLGGDNPNIAVLADDLYENIYKGGQRYLAAEKEKQTEENDEPDDVFTAGVDTLIFPLVVIDYKEWADHPEVDQALDAYFDQRQALVEKAELAGEDSTFFTLKSAYQTRQQSREESGLTLLSSIIIGSVFFIFSASTIAFRIYGELERDKSYHKTLHIIGVPKKNRKQIITIEMGTLFFLPIFVAVVNYLIIMWAINPIFSFAKNSVPLALLGTASLFQVLFFLIVRRSYCKAVDLDVEL